MRRTIFGCALTLSLLFGTSTAYAGTAEENKEKSVMEIVRIQKQAKQDFFRIREELANEVALRCYISEDETGCADFAKLLLNNTALRKSFQDLLHGEILMLTHSYSNRVCWASDGDLQADPLHQPDTVLLCLQSPPQRSLGLQAQKTESFEKPSKTKTLSLDDFRDLEKKFRALAEKIYFAVGVDDTNTPGYSSSAFLITPKGQAGQKRFLVTAGHVAGHIKPSSRALYIFQKGRSDSITTNSKFRTSEVLDIAAAELPSTMRIAAPGTPRTEIISSGTPIAVLCNPFYFGISVRTGFFSKIDEKDNSLSLEFPGIGVENNCSGSPVVDEDGRIIGFLVRTFPSGRLAYAVPIATVLEFIREEFR